MEENLDVLDQGSAQTANITQQKLPNAGGILTMGILSIIFCGLIGLILGVIALSLSGPALKTYEANPGMYTEGSYKNVKAGRVCAIIGLSLLGLVLLIVIAMVAVN